MKIKFTAGHYVTRAKEACVEAEINGDNVTFFVPLSEGKFSTKKGEIFVIRFNKKGDRIYTEISEYKGEDTTKVVKLAEVAHAVAEANYALKITN